MASLQLSSIGAAGLTVGAQLETATITVGFIGSCDMDTNLLLEQFLAASQPDAIRRYAPDLVRVD